MDFSPITEGLHGPGKFRFIVQPAIAIALGIRDGKHDAREGLPPYFLHLITDKKNRAELGKSAFVAISKPLFAAWLMDTLFQVFVLGHWSPFQALFVGLGLIAVPYILARGITNRVVSRNSGRRGAAIHPKRPRTPASARRDEAA